MRLTVPEAARRAGRNPETIRRWIWSGRLPAEKVGNQHVIEEEALDALVAPPTAVDDSEPESVPDVPGEWGEWLRRARELQKLLRARGACLPPASEMIREGRRGR